MRFYHFLLLLGTLQEANSFAPLASKSLTSSLPFSSPAGWGGEVVSSSGGVIKGCSVEQVGETATEWIITIDGVEADIGRFSEAIYKKITADAKKQQFQGFRPGTIPAHLLPTYRAFAMDECARETVLEAMQQNNIRPFSEARTHLTIENCCIPPPSKKATKKKKSGRKSKGEVDEEVTEVQVEPQWLQFENMKGAIDAGWQPGQSFSFVAKNVKGQKVIGKEDSESLRPLGLNY